MLRTSISYKIISYFILSVFAFILRFYDVSSRAVHHDESLHGFFSFLTSQGDYYSHNPLTHGMFLFNILSGFFWTLGDSEFILRLPFILVGIGIIFLPLLLKKELGFLPIFIFSSLLTFSPSISYFSRFARNDIFMGFILIIFIISIFKYIKYSNNKWLYIMVSSMAFGFTTKETMYINVFGVLLFLFFYSFNDLRNLTLGKKNIKNISNYSKLFFIIFAITLPLAAPLISIFQSSLGLILTTPDGYPGIPPGLPVGNAIIVSWIVTIVFISISIFIGFSLDKKLFLNLFGVFWIIFILMFSTFLISPQGIITGQWQSLGYWLSQQEVARGSQPYYYYFLILITDEFLPFVIGLPLSIIYMIKGDFFKRLISFWAIFSIFSFSFAGEKMPWLIVNLTIPFMILTSIFLSEIILSNYKKSFQILLFYILAAIAILVMITKLLFTNYENLENNLYYDLLFLFISLLIIVFIFLQNKKLFQTKLIFHSFVFLFFVFSIFLTIRTTNFILFKYSDEPKDLLIYTQTSKYLHSINDEIKDLYLINPDLKLAVDNTDGFAWPWMWYLRNRENITWFNDMDYKKLDNNYDVIILNKKNINKFSDDGNSLLLNYEVKRDFSHRKWFPESVYRNKNIKDLYFLISKSNNRIALKDYYIYRDIPVKSGSSDAIFLKSNNLKSIE
jgi:uncharacterized protein (TIGR03663 family)